MNLNAIILTGLPSLNLLKEIPVTTRIIILLRRDHADQSEMDAMTALFPDDELRYVRTDPVDHLEHDQLCRKHDADLVLLPREKPIPSTAMERGVKHLTILPNGKLMRLAGINPVFVEP